MNKQNQPVQTTLFCGIDVSAKTLAVALHRQDGPFQQREFANSPVGHKQLIAWLLKGGGAVRVALEATGIYSLDVALALDAASDIEVAVLNPKLVNRFAQTLRRSKTDKADAVALAEYSLRMPFVPWRRPSPAALALRAISRHIATLTKQHTAQSNRGHACGGSASTPRCVRQDIKRSMDGLKKRIARLRRDAIALIEQDVEMTRKFQLLMGIKGIAETSAVQLLGELASLDPEMTVRQWVAHTGLDPAHQVSGSSVQKPSRISRHGNSHLRQALFMPALVATRFEPYMKAFYLHLQARHKTKLQALTAVARELLHAIYGLFKTNTAYDGAKLFPEITIA
ncbi:MAG: IS110 family transposase [Acidobacteriota bacterium]